jgi:hypothetical protein
MAAGGKLVAGVECSGTGIRIALLTLKPVPTVIHCEEIQVQPGDEPRIGILVSPQPAPGRHYLFTAPKLTRSELLQVAVRELKRDGTVDPNNAYYTVDALEAADTEGGGKGQRYLLVALAKEPVDVAALALLESKLVVRSATTSAMGLMRAAQVTDLPTSGITALAQLDIRRSTLLVLENGVPRFFRDIPTSFAKGGREGADDALIAQALARELDISLVFFAQQFRPKQVDTVMIVGDAEVADRVSEWLEESQTYKVVRFGANPKLRTQPNTPSNLLPYAAAVGAALGGVKRAPASDLLPSDLRGRPERVIATGIAAAVVILELVGIMQLRAQAVHRTDEAEARLLNAKTQFDEMKSHITAASELDDAASHSDVWHGFFDNVDLYHKKFAGFLFHLEKTVPGRTHFTRASASTILGVRPPPPAGKKQSDIRVHLEGLARNTDLMSAQGEVLNTYRATENLTPEVLSSTLQPLPTPPVRNGVVEMPFVIDLDVTDAFPGPRK